MAMDAAEPRPMTSAWAPAKIAAALKDALGTALLALGLAVPASRYRASPRPLPERLPEWEYDTTDAVRKVQADGTISFRGRDWLVGEAFRGERVAVRPTTRDGLWQVYFGAHPVAEIDLLAIKPPDDTCVNHVPEHL